LFPELRNSEINISMMAERRSSLEYVPPNAEAESGSGFSSLIHSTAVVKQSSVIRPTPLSKIESQTNLNLPPTNWLKDNPSSKGFNQTQDLHSGFTSFRIANDFVDCLADVDVVSDGENIKKILKIPYSNAPVSMVVHRVGKTLLIDDFDISKFILRRSATEWEWIRKFFHEIVLQQIDKPENAVVRKDGSSSALQERNLMSKFLYRSLQTSLDAEACSSRESTDIKSLSLETLALPQLPDPSLDQVPNFMNTEKFVRNYLWTFEDIRMMIGSNMPIFGDQDHPCVSLRLRDMKKPINILTALCRNTSY